jgi:hypothetical protein
MECFPEPLATAENSSGYLMNPLASTWNSGGYLMNPVSGEFGGQLNEWIYQWVLHEFGASDLLLKPVLFTIGCGAAVVNRFWDRVNAGDS